MANNNTKSQNTKGTKKAQKPTSSPQTNIPKDTAQAFDENTFPLAVGHLFELNNYRVEYKKHIHGAEVDVVAHSKGDPFAPPVFIEATVQYVENTKYGKDLTKFVLVREKERRCLCISVSATGFTSEVRERASESGIVTETYDQLFQRFEKFDPYVDFVSQNQSIRSLVNAYEEPFFRDAKGEQVATTWLSDWKGGNNENAKWLIILGEYGTGKTSLSLVLQHRWLQEYKTDPLRHIPIRIELRSFSRQFDARSLLHHFLDTNGLSHIPIDFMMHLIRTGRVLLILDGYDEMAQFLNSRERRACLSALAELSSDGARGILTSRPNYFTEAEELNVFDALYTSLEQNKYHLTQMDKLFIAEERSVDALVESYVLNRNERYLRDLSIEQTEALVRRKLSGDVSGQEIVLTLLKKVFREETDGVRQSLSGKPVIISYLLELIDELKNDSAGGRDPGQLTEWQIYKLIVDRLMMRDLHRSPLDPALRRRALQKLAIVLSGKDTTTANDQIFFGIIDDLFRNDLRRRSPEDRRMRREELFQDLRSSATLTRSEGGGSTGWFFSHNSLREYLVAEAAVGSIVSETPIELTIPISSAMRAFVASMHEDAGKSLLEGLRNLWPQRTRFDLGAYVTLVWDLLRRADGGLGHNLKLVMGEGDEGNLAFNGVALHDIELSRASLSSDSLKLNAAGSSFIRSRFRNIALDGCDFSGSIFDNVTIENCSMLNCDFRGSLLFECDISGVDVRKADFRGIDGDTNFVVRMPDGSIAMQFGQSAVGYLNFNGAITDPVEPFFVLQHHPKFAIVAKICERIMDQKNSQLRGLTQRGAAQSDPPFARDFVAHLKSHSLIEIDRNELVSATPEGRREIPNLVSHQVVPECIAEFLSRH